MEKSKVLMDTSAYVAFLRGDPEVKEAAQQADEIVFNPVVLGELKAGFLMGKNEKIEILIGVGEVFACTSSEPFRQTVHGSCGDSGSGDTMKLHF